MQIKNVLCAALLLSAVHGYADDLTVSQAIQQALNQSPVIKKAEAVVQEKTANADEVVHERFYPKLSVNATHFLGHKYQILDVPMGDETLSFPTIYPTTTYGFNASLPLYAGYANKRRLEAAKLSESASKKDLTQSEFQLSQKVRLAYYRTVSAKDIQQVTEHHVTVLQDHLKQVQIQKKNGTARDYDVLRVQVQLSEAELDALEAKDNVDIARNYLSVLIGLNADDRVLSDSMLSPNATLISGLEFDVTLKDRSDLNALQIRRDALKKAEAADLAWFSPKITAIGGFEYYNNLNTSLAGDDFRNSYQTGVVLNWDILDSTGAKAKAESKRAQMLQLENELKQAQLEAHAEFDQWKKKYLNSVTRYNVKQLDSERSEESLRLAKLEVKAGTRTNSDLLDAELDLYRAKAGRVIAQMNAVEALLNLESNLGRRLQ